MNGSLLQRLDAHIAMMAPHQKERLGGALLIECQEYIRRLEKDASNVQQLLMNRAGTHADDMEGAGLEDFIAAENPATAGRGQTLALALATDERINPEIILHEKAN
jgi:hypothetical protein